MRKKQTNNKQKALIKRLLFEQKSVGKKFN